MQIDFASSGGVNDRELEYRVDTGGLPEEQARELERLVADSGVFELQQEDANPNVSIGRADVITYRLSFSDGARQTELWLNDISAPASLRPLLARLQELAHRQKRK